MRTATLTASSLMDQATSNRKVSLSRASKATQSRSRKVMTSTANLSVSLRMSSSKKTTSDQSRSSSSRRRAKLSIDLQGRATNDLTKAGVIAFARASANSKRRV